MKTKTCNKCKTVKKSDSFYGRNGVCVTCYKKKTKAYQSKNKLALKKYQKKYYIANIKKLKKIKHKYYLENAKHIKNLSKKYYHSKVKNNKGRKVNGKFK